MIRRSLKNERKSICLFWLVFFAYAIIYMTKNCYSAAMASIVSQGIMTKSETGLISAAFYLVYAPFQIVGGIAADRYSPFRLIFWGTLGAGVCNLLVYLFSGNYIAMLIIWSINAILQFGIWPAVFKIVTSQLCEGHRSKAVFYMSFSSVVGLIFSYVTAALITDWRLNFLFSAVILIVLVAVFGVVYLRLSRYMTEEVITVPDGQRKKKKQSGAFRMLLCSGVPLLLIVYTVHSLLNLGLKSLSPVLLLENYPGISPSVANVLNIALILASPLGLLLSRLPVFKKMTEPMVMTCMLGICVPLLWIVTFVGELPIAVIIVALTVLMVATGLMSVYFSYVAKAFEKYGYGATIAGLFNCMAAIGIVLANFVFAKIADSFGWGVTTKGWLITAIAALILCAITLPIWSRFKEKTKEEEQENRA